MRQACPIPDSWSAHGAVTWKVLHLPACKNRLHAIFRCHNSCMKLCFVTQQPFSCLQDRLHATCPESSFMLALSSGYFL